MKVFLSCASTEFRSYRLKLATQLGALTATQVAVLSTMQLRGLSAAEVGALTTTQLAGLSPTQVAALGPGQVRGLTGTQAAGLTPAQTAAPAQVIPVQPPGTEQLRARNLRHAAPASLHSYRTAAH